MLAKGVIIRIQRVVERLYENVSLLWNPVPAVTSEVSTQCVCNLSLPFLLETQLRFGQILKFLCNWRCCNTGNLESGNSLPNHRFGQLNSQ
jgi:hypothetical protein